METHPRPTQRELWKLFGWRALAWFVLAGVANGVWHTATGDHMPDLLMIPVSLSCMVAGWKMGPKLAAGGIHRQH